MFIGDDVSRLAFYLKSRDLLLCHACQLKDFLSYLEIGGVASRFTLESASLPFTSFASDDQDRSNGVWDKIFLNLDDYGRGFETIQGREAGRFPNLYGPILLGFDCDALHFARDIAVSLKSGWRSDFDRSKDSLQTLDEIDALFQYPSFVGAPSSMLLKSRSTLMEERGGRHVSNPDVSCSFERGYLPWKHLRLILIDPYVFRDGSLANPRDRWLVDIIKERLAPDFRRLLRTRKAYSPRPYHILGRALREGRGSLLDFVENESMPEDVRAWAARVLATPWRDYFENYAAYLSDGTIEPLVDGVIPEPSTAEYELDRIAISFYGATGKVDKSDAPPSNESSGKSGLHRTALCYSCKKRLSSSEDPICVECKWMLCECGACGCQWSKI